jgi:glycine betaine/proline transport system substrate-binding protein
MNWRRDLIAGLAVTVFVTACGSGGSNDESGVTETTTVATRPETSEMTVRPGRANWSTGYFQAAIYSALLAELGYDVSDPALHEYPPSEAYLAMARGEFDFWPNGWFSQHDTWFDQPLADGSLVGDHLVVIGNEIEAGAIEGLVITKSVAKEHGIESLDQINDDPELAALFDENGDGRAEIFGCPEDWTCSNIIDEMIEFNEWSNLEQTSAGYPGLVAASIDRVERGLPTIQYTWSPSGYLSRLRPGDTVLWLSVGGRDLVLDGSTLGRFDFADADPAPLGDECSAVPCWIGWSVADIRVAANQEFADANPSAVALFEAVELEVADLAAQNVRYDNGENTDTDVERHAREWIEAHRELVDQWLDAARSAR